MKVYKVEVLVIDFDDIGQDELKSVIENSHYPNRCINPKVKNIEEREVQWSDEHPLNNLKTSDNEYRKLFG